MPRSNEGGGKIYDARASARTSQFRGCRESGGTRFSSLLLEDEREIRKRLGEEEREREIGIGLGKTGKEVPFASVSFTIVYHSSRRTPSIMGRNFLINRY